jgi:hypothetical protein
VTPRSYTPTDIGPALDRVDLDPRASEVRATIDALYRLAATAVVSLHQANAEIERLRAAQRGA